MTSAKILLIDDDSDAVLSLSRLIKAKSPSSTIEATSKIENVDGISKKFDPDVIILDLTLVPSEGAASGLLVLTRLVKAHPCSRTIVLTGDASIENGVKALERGAAHFLAKPADIHHLLILIEDAAKLSHLKRAYSQVQNELDPLEHLLAGSSDAIKQLREEIRSAAATDQNILITGETGTGKGVCARAVHQLSARHDQPFIRYQPSFASGDLVLSELFGHKKGAFTGAAEDRVGLIKRAEHGTLFLDEIDELPMEVQVALLGVIQEKRYRVLGSDKEETCDVQFIAATNQPVEESIQKAKLRKDLFFRLAQRRINVAALRDRKDDIISLAVSFLSKFSVDVSGSTILLEDSAAKLLMQHTFPGNVRELEAVIRDGAYRALYRGDASISAQDIKIQQSDSNSDDDSYHSKVRALKQQLVRDALERSGNNQVQAAKLLQLDRTSFRRILQET